MTMVKRSLWRSMRSLIRLPTSSLISDVLLETRVLGGSFGCASDWRPGGRGFDPRRGRQHSFVEIDHEIFSTVIFKEGQLSVSGECAQYWLTA